MKQKKLSVLRCTSGGGQLRISDERIDAIGHISLSTMGFMPQRISGTAGGLSFRHSCMTAQDISSALGTYGWD